MQSLRSSPGEEATTLGKQEEGGKKSHCYSAEVDRDSQFCATEGHLEVACHSDVDRRATLQTKRLTVTFYIVDGRETSTLVLTSKRSRLRLHR